MTIRGLIPALHGKGREVPARREAGGLLTFQEEMNRLFDDFFGGFGSLPERMLHPRMAAFSPRMDVAETDTEFRVTAELPGMDEKDIQITLDGNVLTVRGEKKEEHEEKGRHSYRMERSYGSFHRSIPFAIEVDAKKAKASFKKGVLSLTLPKVADAKAGRKRIPISEG